MTDSSNSSADSQSYEGYVLPAENAAEMARLMLQDHMLTQDMGGPLPDQTDLSQIHRILDIGSGPGGWLFDVQSQYPHIHGVGIDISQLMTEYATSMATTQGMSQMQFRVMDATGPLDFPDNTFDLVNSRILMGFLSKQQWPPLLAECRRITRPGGILRLTEPEWGFTNSAAFNKLVGLAALGMNQGGYTFSPDGRTFGTANVLRLLLRQAGYQNIRLRAHAVDFSAGTDIHEGYGQNILIVYRLFQPFLEQTHLATHEEYESLYAQMEEDMRSEDFCAIDYFLTVWGTKPESF